MILITRQVRDAMFAHAVRCRPLESCGLFTEVEGSGLLDEFHPVANAAASPSRFVLDPQEMLAVEQAAAAVGREVVGVMHSHVESSAYPSPTDVVDSGRYDPAGMLRQLIVSVRHGTPQLRAFRIHDGTISELLVVVAEDRPVAHDGAGAVAIAVRQPLTPSDE